MTEEIQEPLNDYLEEGEVFIENVDVVRFNQVEGTIVTDISSTGTKQIPLSAYLEKLMVRGRYNSVRALDVAFSPISGKPLRGARAIVGKRNYVEGNPSPNVIPHSG